MERDYFQDALQTFNGGNWYCWKKEDDDGVIEAVTEDATKLVLDVLSCVE